MNAVKMTIVMLLLVCGFAVADTVEFTRADDFTATDGTALNARLLPTKVGTLGYASAGNSWAATAGWTIQSNTAVITSGATGADYALTRTPWYGGVVAGTGDTFTLSADIRVGAGAGTFLFGYTKATTVASGLFSSARGCYSIAADGSWKFYRIGSTVAASGTLPNFHPEYVNHFDIVVTVADGTASTMYLVWNGNQVHTAFNLSYAISELWFSGVLSNSGIQNSTNFDNFEFTNVPEPATTSLVFIGLAGILFKRMKRI